MLGWLLAYVLHFQLSCAVDDGHKWLVALNNTAFRPHKPAFILALRRLNEINKPCFIDIKTKLTNKAFLLLQHTLIPFNNIHNPHTNLIQLLSDIRIIIDLNILIMHLLLKHFVHG